MENFKAGDKLINGNYIVGDATLLYNSASYAVGAMFKKVKPSLSTITSGAIASVNSFDTGKRTKVTFVAAHSITDYDIVILTNTINYNGTYSAFVLDTKNIVLEKAYNAESTISWTGTKIVNSSFTEPVKMNFIAGDFANITSYDAGNKTLVKFNIAHKLTTNDKIKILSATNERYIKFHDNISVITSTSIVINTPYIAETVASWAGDGFSPAIAIPLLEPKLKGFALEVEYKSALNTKPTELKGFILETTQTPYAQNITLTNSPNNALKTGFNEWGYKIKCPDVDQIKQFFDYNNGNSYNEILTIVASTPKITVTTLSLNRLTNLKYIE